ncbi:Uncharacterised protein [uncultured archaeon]|nr:Uncharacterised protein [uncultured archaeon]
MQPLYRHTSQETAYMINDYPYGRTLRCRRRVWIEGHPKHGYRFVSQTEHPTRKVWNKPHASTYTEIAAGMYLDEQGHVAWTGIDGYTEPKAALEFAKTFGARCEGAARLVEFANGKARLSAKFAAGQACITMNGARVPRSETERANDLEESKVWAEVASLLKRDIIDNREGSA